MSTTPNKSQFIREALDELGPDVKYSQVKDYVLAKHSVTVPESGFYAERKRRQDEAGSPTLAPTTAPTAGEEHEEEEGGEAPSIAISSLPNVIRSVRMLVEICGGKEALKQVIDAL